MLFLSGWRKLKFVVLHAWSLRRDTAACSCSASTSSAVQSTAVSCPNLSCSTWTQSQLLLFSCSRSIEKQQLNALLHNIDKIVCCSQTFCAEKKKFSCFYLLCCRNPSDSAEWLAATICTKAGLWKWVMEALAVMIDWRIFSSFFAILQPSLFADIHISQLWLVSLLVLARGGHFCSQYGRLDGIPAACHSLSPFLPQRMHSIRNLLFYNGFSNRLRDFFMCATALSVSYCMKPYFVICY
jgi:hypothetical protein